ncbi:hypothetical protein RMSM_07023 [Rhodopirellula maiorica SM1]|uniref:Uncharacterized protein n=2 Tax=Novipirellula TaxID=2795426 RepID=M5RL10_9BACT|nr:hypothetical protein RMSM_07023 [Rhodopirellula maiorica SM1]
MPDLRSFALVAERKGKLVSADQSLLIRFGVVNRLVFDCDGLTGLRVQCGGRGCCVATATKRHGANRQ